MLGIRRNRTDSRDWRHVIREQRSGTNDVWLAGGSVTDGTQRHSPAPVRFASRVREDPRDHHRGLACSLDLCLSTWTAVGSAWRTSIESRARAGNTN